MYLMFLASSHDGKVNLVEWKSDHPEKLTDIAEEFERALDYWSQVKPHMGDWSLIQALTVHGGRIVPAQQRELPGEQLARELSKARADRRMAAIKESLNG